jgi:hypothetical protein
MAQACGGKQMKNMRTYVMSKHEQVCFNPADFTESLKDAGFIFDSDACPVKIKQPWCRTERADGTVIYRQWEE